MKLFVAVPVYRDIPAEFAMSLVNLVADRRCPFEILVNFLVGDSYVSKARNRLTTSFLKSDCSHLLWIDCDLVFTTQDIARLVSHDKAIVGGMYCIKRPGYPHWLLDFLPDLPPRDERGLQPLQHIGAGFLLIRRDVFERMIATYGPEIAYTDPVTRELDYNLWQTTIHKGHFYGEDYTFCERARELGFQIFGDWNVILPHLGTASYPLRTFTPPEVAHCHELLEAGNQNNKMQERERATEALSRQNKGEGK